MNAFEVTELFRLRWNSYSELPQGFVTLLYGMGAEVKTKSSEDVPVDIYTVTVTKKQYQKIVQWIENNSK